MAFVPEIVFYCLVRNFVNVASMNYYQIINSQQTAIHPIWKVRWSVYRFSLMMSTVWLFKDSFSSCISSKTAENNWIRSGEGHDETKYKHWGQLYFCYYWHTNLFFINYCWSTQFVGSIRKTKTHVYDNLPYVQYWKSVLCPIKAHIQLQLYLYSNWSV